MPQTRYIEEYDQQGNLIGSIPYEVSDSELALEALITATIGDHEAILSAYQNWDSLTPAERMARVNELFPALLRGWLAHGVRLGLFQNPFAP